MSYIEIKNLSKKFSDTAGIENITLPIEKGAFVSIVGPFGTGKTTLLRCIAGLINDYDGTVKIDGAQPLDVLKKGGVGFAFQQPSLLPWRSVVKNITLPQEIKGNKSTTEAMNLLKVAGLTHIASKRPSELSGGMRQIVSILRSMILQPKILLLDEPFSSVDELTKDKLNKKLLDIHNASDMTTIMITHSLQEAVFLSDEVIVLTPGPGRIKRRVKIDFSRSEIADKYSQKAHDYVALLRKEMETE